MAKALVLRVSRGCDTKLANGGGGMQRLKVTRTGSLESFVSGCDCGVQRRQQRLVCESPVSIYGAAAFCLCAWKRHGVRLALWWGYRELLRALQLEV